MAAYVAGTAGEEDGFGVRCHKWWDVLQWKRAVWALDPGHNAVGREQRDDGGAGGTCHDRLLSQTAPSAQIVIPGMAADPSTRLHVAQLVHADNAPMAAPPKLSSTTLPQTLRRHTLAFGWVHLPRVGESHTS